MDYESAYKQALERAKSMMALPDDKAMIEEIFPELKESEDEKIKRGLIALIKESLIPPTLFRFGLNKEDTVAWLEKQGEQKPAEWSAYDKATLEYIIEDIKELRDSETDESSIEAYERELNLLQAINESTKLSNYTNPAEWSEEDEQMIEDIIEAIDTNYAASDYHEMVDWLKSLRPQNTWKPSDEQMEALEHFIVHHNGSTNYAKDLEELRLQLKKLK